MARKNRNAGRSELHKISSYRELRHVRREIDMELWYVEGRLADDVADAFSLDNLLAVIAPRGSALDRLIGGAANGFATVRGIARGLCAARRRRNG